MFSFRCRAFPPLIGAFLPVSTKCWTRRFKEKKKRVTNVDFFYPALRTRIGFLPITQASVKTNFVLRRASLCFYIHLSTYWIFLYLQATLYFVDFSAFSDIVFLYCDQDIVQIINLSFFLDDSNYHSHVLFNLFLSIFSQNIYYKIIPIVVYRTVFIIFVCR